MALRTPVASSFDEDAPSTPVSPHLSNLSAKPEWVSDDDQRTCKQCRKPFSMLNRRHHCRACGNIFCNNCSSNKLDLSHLGYIGEQRVCDKCFKQNKPASNKKRDRRQTMSKPIIQSRMLLTDILGRPMKHYYFSLTQNSFRWYKTANEQLAAFHVMLNDILAVEKPSASEFIIHAYPKHGSKNKKQREKMVIRVRCATKEECDLWAMEISTRIPTSGNSGRRLLVLVNPFGGKKQAVSIWKSVQSMLTLAGIDVNVQYTEYQGHASEVVASIPLGSYDGIVGVSGDGLIHEIFNGLMSRPDWQEAIKIPVGTIPGGSGNALAFDMGNGHPIAATFSIAKGTSRPLDLFKVEQEGQKTLYSFLSVNWGLISDVDFESEKYRFMGGARFTLGAVVRISNLRYYSARLEYRPSKLSTTSFCSKLSDCVVCKAGRKLHGVAKESEPSANTDASTSDPTGSLVAKMEPESDSESSSEFINSEEMRRRQQEGSGGEEEEEQASGSVRRNSQHLPDTDSISAADEGVEEDSLRRRHSKHTSRNELEIEEDDWESMEGEFVTIIACNLAKLSHDVTAAPYAHYSDGSIDLLIIKRCTRAQLMNLFAFLETGEFVNSATFNEGEIVKYIKVDEFKLTTLKTGKEKGETLFGFDGERAKSKKPIHVTNMCAAANIMG